MVVEVQRDMEDSLDTQTGKVVVALQVRLLDPPYRTADLDLGGY